MEALMLWVTENILILIIAALNAMAVFLWKDKDPKKQKKIKLKKAEKHEKLGDINKEQAEMHYKKAIELRKEVENEKNA